MVKYGYDSLKSLGSSVMFYFTREPFQQADVLDPSVPQASTPFQHNTHNKRQIVSSKIVQCFRLKGSTGPVSLDDKQPDQNKRR